VRGSIRLTFDLPSGGKLRADLYDVTGTRIRTVVNRSWAEGHHSVTVDLSEVPAGVYFVRVEAPGFECVTRRLVVLP
jgi:hypothetical protein